MAKIKRPLIAHFLYTAATTAGTSKAKNVSGETVTLPTFTPANWIRIGTNVTDMAIDFGAQTETEQDIVSNSASTDVTGYQPTSAVAQQCTEGDGVFEYVAELRRSRAILGDAETYTLNVDMYKAGTSEGSFVAELQKVSIQLDSYGGAGGETPTQEFTINYIGDPIAGTITIASTGPTFAAAEPVTSGSGQST